MEKQAKKYEKPEIYIESFQLSHHIALCDYQLGSAEHTCTVITDRVKEDYMELSGTGFANANACTTPVQAYCYTNGSDAFPKIFQS